MVGPPVRRAGRSAAGDGELLALADLGSGQRVELLDAVHHCPDLTGLGELGGDGVEGVAGLTSTTRTGSGVPPVSEAVAQPAIGIISATARPRKASTSTRRPRRVSRRAVRAGR